MFIQVTSISGDFDFDVGSTSIRHQFDDGHKLVKHIFARSLILKKSLMKTRPLDLC